VLACQQEEGGFGAFPGDISALRPTAWALDALRVLGVPVPRPEDTAGFILSQQNDDGGFRGRPWGLRWTERSGLVDSYHAARALQALGRDIPRARELAEFVRSRQRADGAFLQDLYPEKAGVCAETFCAASILNALGLRVPRRADVIVFLRRMQSENVRRDGGFIAEDTPDWEELVEAARRWAESVDPYRDPEADETRAIPVAIGYTSATDLAIRALSLLGDRPPDVPGAVTFLCGQQGESGGLLSGMGDYGAYQDRSEGRMFDTYHAVSGLRLLAPAEGAESQTEGEAWSRFLSAGRIDVAQCAAWLAACHNPDGGFARGPDPLSRPSDMAATAQAILTLSALGRPLPSPAAGSVPRREELPEGVRFELCSPFFQPDQPGQALYLHRIVAPIRAACGSDEGTALALMRWLHRHIVFHQNSRNEAALIIEDGLGACGPQARCLAGMLEATGIRARFLMVVGHCTCEGYIDGRWRLLDAMFDGAFRGPDGRLYSALDVHEQHRRGRPEITTFGDWRYESYTIYEPKGGAEYHEFAIAAGDTAESPSARAAYPELSG
jgi:hypothetical protein